MKFPKSFRPNKDLENKTKQLIKNSNKILIKSEEITEINPTTIIRIAEETAIQKGKKYFFSDYVFKKENLIIQYSLPMSWDVSTITIYLKKGLFKKEKVFQSYNIKDEERIKIYIPGEWVDQLNNHYNNFINCQ